MDRQYEFIQLNGNPSLVGRMTWLLIMIVNKDRNILFRQWQDCISELRKLEENVLEILKKRGELVDVKEAKKMFSEEILRAKSKINCPAGRANHFFDCEVYALAAADFYQVALRYKKPNNKKKGDKSEYIRHQIHHPELVIVF